ncbi:hypothetical protein INS49_014250 [Diaporthe citri]|uniref:uncharacterized protein n=1 Tax=Diaporthe citri TaxID=83186 RepID=UPI001C7F3863|nr:uncharacterized protein INS49_014250 [Diaporthe citri]KAG6358366.1 hypothetical protein INS49_014250 [Diaporthe citri]
MEQTTPPDSGQAAVQQMFTTLLGEIASLRKQNDDQQRQLEHLRRDMSLCLERSDNSPQRSRMPHFKRLPLEVREMIWELAMPSRLLGFEGVTREQGVPSALSVPAVAQVCRESRRVVMSRKSLVALSGRSTHLEGPSQLWRLDYTESGLWTWFTPRKDALLINPRNFTPYERSQRNHLIVQSAEHIVIEDCSLWYRLFENCIDDDDFVTLKRLSTWVHQLVPEPELIHSSGDAAYNLRTVDFAMSTVTKVDRSYPPNFVRRLFAEDEVRIVDLRDEEAVRGIGSMLEHEVSQVMDSNLPLEFPTELQHSYNSFRAAAGDVFLHVRASLLSALAGCYHYSSSLGGPKPLATLPSPFRGDELDMEVAWVKELAKRIIVRPVHVFVRDDGMPRPSGPEPPGRSAGRRVGSFRP